METGIAALTDGDSLYYAEYPLLPFAPHTPVTQLIQGIYAQFSDKALRLLRHPIRVNYSPTLLCRSMTAVAAKRLKQDTASPIQEWVASHPHRIEIAYKAELTPSMEFDANAMTSLSIPIPRYQQNRKVRAFLFNREGELLSGAVNQNAIQKTNHAEVLALQSYYQQHREGFQSPTILITSLQCCKMCAAMFWQMHHNPLENLKVFYLEKEVGPIARDTVFTAKGNTRRSLVHASVDLLKEVEFPLTENSWSTLFPAKI